MIALDRREKKNEGEKGDGGKEGREVGEERVRKCREEKRGMRRRKG